MRIVAIGDIGVVDDMFHVGDEAMFEEAVHRMRQRGIVDIVAVSANPPESAGRYGLAAIDRIGFAGSRRELLARMDAVLQTAAGDSGLLAEGDPARRVIDAIRSGDGLLVSGGGNLASNWPAMVIERATMGGIAGILGRPLVVTGQTIGPDLTPDDADLVAGLLGSATLVGVREGPSYSLARDLGVPPERLRQTVDDASFLGEDSAGTPRPWPYCLISFSGHVGAADRDRYVARAAGLLDHIAEATGLEVVFFAHFASLSDGNARGDSVLHDAIRDRMSSPRADTVLPTDSVTAARLARGASLVVSSRYHPAVFAASAGVPTIGVAVDAYTTIKLTGALGNFGQQSVLSAADLVDGHGPGLASAIWADREAIRDRGVTIAAGHRVAASDWWDRVAAALAPA